MRIIIKTEYTLIDDEGNMFDEASASTEEEISSREGLEDAIDAHDMKTGKCERNMGVQVTQLSSRVPEPAEPDF